MLGLRRNVILTLCWKISNEYEVRSMLCGMGGGSNKILVVSERAHRLPHSG